MNPEKHKIGAQLGGDCNHTGTNSRVSGCVINSEYVLKIE